jgi:hypothetical protein
VLVYNSPWYKPKEKAGSKPATTKRAKFDLNDYADPGYDYQTPTIFDHLGAKRSSPRSNILNQSQTALTQ